MVKPKSFDMASGALCEPFFFRLAVYDVVAMCKVTEDVLFDLNSDKIFNMVSNNAPAITRTRNVSFVEIILCAFFCPPLC